MSKPILSDGDPVYRWADDLEVGDRIFIEAFGQWEQITGIRDKTRSLADKHLAKEFLLTGTTLPEQEFQITHMILEFTYDDVLLCRRRKAA